MAPGARRDRRSRFGGNALVYVANDRPALADGGCAALDRPRTRIARGRGVALINASIAEQLPRGIALVALAQPATLTFDAVWHQGELPLIERTLMIAAQLAREGDWM